MTMWTQPVAVMCFKAHDKPAPSWRVMVEIAAIHDGPQSGSWPVSRAVVDDFGNLVLVGGWL